MNKELYHIAAQSCADVYHNHLCLGTTQFQHKIVTAGGRKYQILAIAGTNQFRDHVRNINVFWSEKGIKLGSYNEAVEVRNAVKLYPHLPIVVTGHSKGGASAIAFFLLFCNPKKDFCIPFNPARCLRYWRNRKMERTVMFTDPDDPVSELLGIINFGLPICKTYEASKDSWFFDISFKDHRIDKMVTFTKHMKEVL